MQGVSQFIHDFHVLCSSRLQKIFCHFGKIGLFRGDEKDMYLALVERIFLHHYRGRFRQSARTFFKALHEKNAKHKYRAWFEKHPVYER